MRDERFESAVASLSVLQIIGFVLIAAAPILPTFVHALISITGFAAVVKIHLPLEDHQTPLAFVAAVSGVGIIIFSCLKIAAAT